MKRTIKRPDGTEEFFEGTPEELAEYERKLVQQQKPLKPEILKGVGSGLDLETIEKIQEIMDRAKRTRERKFPDWHPFWRPGPIWVASCPICHLSYCTGHDYFPEPCRITWASTKLNEPVTTISETQIMIGRGHKADFGSTLSIKS